MRIAVCFYGLIQHVDSFMLNSLLKCIIHPIRKHFKNPTINFFFHSFFTSRSVARVIDLIQQTLSLEEMILQNPSSINEPSRSIGYQDKKRLTQESRERASQMWITHNFDLILTLRSDLLFTREIGKIDLEIIHSSYHENRVFLPECDSAQNDCICIGNPIAVRKYWTRNSRHIRPGLSSDCVAITRIMIVFVRVREDASIEPTDVSLCPYIEDILQTSTSMIYVARKTTEETTPPLSTPV